MVPVTPPHGVVLPGLHRSGSEPTRPLRRYEGSAAELGFHQLVA